jgi:hypothetical protein
MTYLFPNDIEIKNDAGNAIPISRNNVTNSNNNPLYVTGVNNTSFFAPTQTDAFGRLRVSNPFTLFDSFHRYQDNGKITQYTAGTASSVHDANAGSIVMTIGGASGDRIYRESNRVFAYQPGKSLLIFQTFCMAPATAGLRQRQGYFDTEQGVYLELAGSTLSLVRRSSVSGSLLETRATQANWNIDRLDGTGPSGYTLDITKTQILWWDIEWLGVGSVRSGFVIEGKFIQTHTFHHANQAITAQSDTRLPYMATACLPVRVEFENTAATSVTSNYRIICTSVISEGGYELRGRPSNASHPISAPYRLLVANTLYPILSIRLKSTRPGAIVLPKTYSISVADAGNFRYHVINGATTTGGAWVSAGDSSSVEYNLGPTAYTGGSILETSYIISTNQAAGAPSGAEFPFKFQLERNTFTNTMYEFLLVIESDAVNTDVFAQINWEEIT